MGEKEDTLVSHCFTTVAKEEPKEEIDWKEMKPIYSDLGLVYLPDENNILGQKFTEYFTSKLARDLVVFGDKLVEKDKFKTDPE